MMLLVFRHERGKFDCVANSFSSCFWDVAVIASEMVHGWSNVKASHSMVGPCATFLRSFVHYDFASWWRHWRFSKLKIPHSWLYAESLGFMREGRTMFRVFGYLIVKTVQNWFNACTGKVYETVFVSLDQGFFSSVLDGYGQDTVGVEIIHDKDICMASC